MKCIALLLFSLFLHSFLNAQSTDTQILSIGEIKTLKSVVLNENRVLNIYLPDSFNQEKKYPVIYLLDGSLNEDFLHIVGLVQFFNLQMKMPDFIIVGIANVDRKRDFTFHTDVKELLKEYPTTGYSSLFIQFLETELQPYIESEYNTTRTKYLIGQSLGGLLATEILLKKPALFTHYLIVSPSLWWDNESLLKQAPSLLKEQEDLETYVYVSVGKKEHPVMKKDAKKLVASLKKSTKQHLRLDYLLMKKDNHATILHSSIYEGFLKLFPFKE